MLSMMRREQTNAEYDELAMKTNQMTADPALPLYRNMNARPAEIWETCRIAHAEVRRAREPYPSMSAERRAAMRESEVHCYRCGQWFQTNHQRVQKCAHRYEALPIDDRLWLGAEQGRECESGHTYEALQECCQSRLCAAHERESKAIRDLGNLVGTRRNADP